MTNKRFHTANKLSEVITIYTRKAKILKWPVVQSRPICPYVFSLHLNCLQRAISPNTVLLRLVQTPMTTIVHNVRTKVPQWCIPSTGRTPTRKFVKVVLNTYWIGIIQPFKANWKSRYSLSPYCTTSLNYHYLFNLLVHFF